MGFTYTDSTKIILEAWGKFKVTLLEAVEVGDLLSWYNTDNAYTVQLADESDSQRANCIAMEKGAAGDEITACLKAVCRTKDTVGTGGVVTRVYFAASADFFGAPIYLGEDGKPESDTGSTYEQRAGRLLARNRILLEPDSDLDMLLGGKWKFNSWGTVIAGNSLYFRADYSAYVNSWIAGGLELVGAVTVRMNVGGKGWNVGAGGICSTAYTIRCTGVIDFGASHTGSLQLPQKADPITQPTEGMLWYNTTSDKLQFSTASGKETVTSS